MVFAQSGIPGQVMGSFQTDVQYTFKDSIINAPYVPSRLLMNGYGQITYTLGGFSCGARYEAYLNPLLGIDPRYQGSGLPYRFAGYRRDNLQITIGNFYEQFGSGMILRAYWEPLLGVDTNLDGIRIQGSPFKGVYVKGLVAKQRTFFTLGPGLVRGGDLEFAANEVFGEMKGVQLTLGGSFVSRFQPDTDPIYRLPENVAAYSGRLNLRKGNFSLEAEYAEKENDPNATNGFIYKRGQGLWIAAGYSKKGIGVNLAVKRLDNMDFRSDRTATGTNLMVNFLPPLAKQHTWRQPTLYLYATQPNGEMGLQADLNYTIPKNTWLGGKYGTTLSINYSNIHSIDTVRLPNELGYTSDFFKIGNRLYYQDINIEINHKFSESFKASYALLLIDYDKDQILQLTGFGKINVQAHVVELVYKLDKKHAFRAELQHMDTRKKDFGNWAMALIEYTAAPYWFVSAFSEYNYGNPDPDKRVFYPNFTIGHIRGGNRVSIGYSRQRAGIICVGGICRVMPASNGFTMSVTSTF